MEIRIGFSIVRVRPANILSPSLIHTKFPKDYAAATTRVLFSSGIHKATAMSASLSLPPAHVSPVSLLIKTQIRTKPRPPPPSTTLTGKTALITGSSSGLGRAAGEQLLALGLSRLIMGIRDGPKGERVAAALRTKFPQARVDVWTVEQESYDSVRAFAARCADADRLDMVILNAAFATPEWRVTENVSPLYTFQHPCARMYYGLWE